MYLQKQKENQKKSKTKNLQIEKIFYYFSLMPKIVVSVKTIQMCYVFGDPLSSVCRTDRESIR